ncbi:hypothetical protein PGB90_010035 [Kerria lacca]
MFQYVLDTVPEINKPLSAKYIKSFAYPTFKERIPAIIQGIVDQLKNKEDIKNKFGQGAYDELDSIINQILDLKKSLQSDKPLTEFTANNVYTYETNAYNKMIQHYTNENKNNPPTWFQTDWLFAECYLYFKLHRIFCFSNAMKKYDPFLQVKIDTLLASQDAIFALNTLLIEMKNKININESEKKKMFTFFLKCSLWGNKADLSLSGGKAVSTNKETFNEMNNLDTCILVSNIDDVYELLCKNEDNVVDIVLDNAGYELFNDLCFADFLIWSGLVKKIIFHGKLIPWFVSDVTTNDFNLTFIYLKTELKSENMMTSVNTWTKYLHEEKWIMRCESFWILPYDYSKMQTESPQLYKSLSENILVIFKGDLNYRKLVGDINWEPTTNFGVALRGFHPTNILALRTVKADTISGLKKGIFEELNSNEPDWMITGKYALVQLLKK